MSTSSEALPQSSNEAQASSRPVKSDTDSVNAAIANLNKVLQALLTGHAEYEAEKAKRLANLDAFLKDSQAKRLARNAAFDAMQAAIEAKYKAKRDAINDDYMAKEIERLALKEAELNTKEAERLARDEIDEAERLAKYAAIDEAAKVERAALLAKQAARQAEWTKRTDYYAKLKDTEWTLVAEKYVPSETIQDLLSQPMDEFDEAVTRLTYLISKAKDHSIDATCIDMYHAGTYLDVILWEHRKEGDWVEYKRWYDAGIQLIECLSTYITEKAIPIDGAINGIVATYRGYQDITKA